MASISANRETAGNQLFERTNSTTNLTVGDTKVNIAAKRTFLQRMTSSLRKVGPQHLEVTDKSPLIPKAPSTPMPKERKGLNLNLRIIPNPVEVFMNFLLRGLLEEDSPDDR